MLSAILFLKHVIEELNQSCRGLGTISDVIAILRGPLQGEGGEFLDVVVKQPPDPIYLTMASSFTEWG